jgi:large subunit ribosomal protein L6
MSRVGKKLVTVPNGVEINIAGTKVDVKGPKGQLSINLPDAITIKKNEDGTYSLDRATEETKNKALHGLSRSLVANMVKGVTDGYSKTLEIVGTGYKVTAKGNDLEFALGYSHPVIFPAPAGISFKVVGETAAKVRKLRKQDPYKGKGIRFDNEVIRRKAGKAGK